MFDLSYLSSPVKRQGWTEAIESQLPIVIPL